MNSLLFPFDSDAPPSWASGYGQDEFGFFAEFSIGTGPNYWEFVTQRMRWIPPGRFLMGSPATEAERWDDEGPQHEVVLTKGYWLADTACTQALWKAVMHENPSHFQADDGYCPVEQVSYDNVTKFLQRLANILPGLRASLPTEAQWEYSCRAGTTTPFSFGSAITTDQANYDGDFPYNGGPKGEDRQRTLPVKALPPNRWGLYQMHGNVWEWCHDWYGPYDAAETTDPLGAKEGSLRVVRGGGWSVDARYVRSACRSRLDPGLRHNVLGFRLLSPAEPEQVTEQYTTPSQ